MLTKDDVRKVIREAVIGFDVDSLDDESPFTENGIDSLDQIGIMFAIDEKHGIKIPDEDAVKCNSINDIVEYVKGMGV